MYNVESPMQLIYVLKDMVIFIRDQRSRDKHAETLFMHVNE